MWADDLDEIVRAAVQHAWKRHGPEGDNSFERYGIETIEQLESHVRAVIAHDSTAGFVRDPGSGERQATEFYKGPLPTGADRPDHATFVILNPNVDADGAIYGGTIFIRAEAEFERQHEQVTKARAGKPEIVQSGGREALLAQERFRQALNDRHAQEEGELRSRHVKQAGKAHPSDSAALRERQGKEVAELRRQHEDDYSRRMGDRRRAEELTAELKRSMAEAVSRGSRIRD